MGYAIIIRIYNLFNVFDVRYIYNIVQKPREFNSDIDPVFNP